MSTPTAPRKEGLPREIADGEFISFARLNRRFEGFHFRGGLHFRRNTIYPTRFFPNMARTMFLRNPEPRMSPKRGYRVVYFPSSASLHLWDFTLDPRRGVVLQLAALSFVSPPAAAVKSEIQLEPGGQWCTDLALAGADNSNQLWLHHLPTELLRAGVEASERWIFGLKRDDVLIEEV